MLVGFSSKFFLCIGIVVLLGVEETKAQDAPKTKPMQKVLDTFQFTHRPNPFINASSLIILKSGTIRYSFQSEPFTGSGGRVVHKEWKVSQQKAESLLADFVKNGLLDLKESKEKFPKNSITVSSGDWVLTIHPKEVPKKIFDQMLPLLQKAHPQEWANTQKEQKAIVEDPSGIACQLSGSYIGNAISPVFSLKIDAPPAKTWSYTVVDNMFGMIKTPKFTGYLGVYEIDDDLAVFTGKGVDGTEFRFGLNFKRLHGKVTFDRFFLDDKGKLTYHRKWFRKVNGRWQPAEERQLTLQTQLPTADAKTWKAHWKGKRILWDEKKKKTETPIDVQMIYKMQFPDRYRAEDPKLPRWIPGELIVQRDGDQVISLNETNRYIGDLRGFHPSYATLPMN